MPLRRHCLLLAPAFVVAAAACGPGDQPTSPSEPAVADETSTPTSSPAPPEQGVTEAPSEPSPEREPEKAAARPEWLGQRELPTRDDGYGQVRDTPAELVDRRLPPPESGLPPPPADGSFAASIEPVPDPVVARSTWRPECPVALDELRYVTVTFWGFDDRPHTGEVIVHRRVAEDVAAVFERLFRARFPIEELRVVRSAELDAPPTGDGNNSTGFVCREITGGQAWSQHARGLAVDINPFHNPYRRGDLVVPELASAYLDREHHRPGMIQRGDVVTEAFADIGWGWGGDWQSLADWMHFSESGR